MFDIELLDGESEMETVFVIGQSRKNSRVLLTFSMSTVPVLGASLTVQFIIGERRFRILGGKV